VTVFLANVAGSVGHEQQEVSRFECGAYLGHHSPVEHRFGGMNPGRIEEDDLCAFIRPDALHGGASRLRFLGHDRQLGADQGVQQR
jgi:hypothetical protein